MTKNEFIIELRRYLGDALPISEVENNIQYYAEYISSSGKTEEETIQEIGDPRLIAKTIIEGYKISKGMDQLNAREFTGQSQSEDTEREENYKQSGYTKRSFYSGTIQPIPWYKKLVLAVIFLLIVVGIIVISSMVIQLLLSVAVPILLIILAVKLFRGGIRK